MFLNLDKKDRSKIAVIDDSKQSVTYGYLCDFATEFKNHLPERTLTFILAENTIGSLLGYFAMLSNRIVPLILSRNTDRTLLRLLLFWVLLAKVLIQQLREQLCLSPNLLPRS